MLSEKKYKLFAEYFFQVSYVLIVQPPDEKDKVNDESGMNVYDFDADGDVDFGDSDDINDDKSKIKSAAKRSQTVSRGQFHKSFNEMVSRTRIFFRLRYTSLGRILIKGKCQ